MRFSHDLTDSLGAGSTGTALDLIRLLGYTIAFLA